MSKYDLILKGGRVLDPANGKDGLYDIGISSGHIAEVETELDPGLADGMMDVSGRWVLPGVIDSHVHVATTGVRIESTGEDAPWQIDGEFGGRGPVDVRLDSRTTQLFVP